MNKSVQFAKLLACIVGGAVTASLMLVLACFLFGFYKSDSFTGFMRIANPLAGILGSICGVVIFFYSGKTR